MENRGELAEGGGLGGQARAEHIGLHVIGELERHEVLPFLVGTEEVGRHDVGVAALICLLTAPQPLLSDFLLLFLGIMLGAGLWCGLLALRSVSAPSATFFRLVNLIVGVLAALIGVYGLWFVVTHSLAG